MRIAYVTPYDATDVSSWSGLGFFIGRALEHQSIEVAYIGPVSVKPARFGRIKASFIRRILGKGYWPQVEPIILDRIALAEQAKLKDAAADVVLGLAADHISRLKCTQPMVLWTDSPLAGLIDFYDYATNLCASSRRQIFKTEQVALDRCAAVVYTSAWAAEVATRTYNILPEKIHIIPFGANLEQAPTTEGVSAAIRARGFDSCRLLFFGVDWNRKGGDIALDTVRILNEIGIPARLIVLGCHPPKSALESPYIEPLGFISKRTSEGRSQIANLIASSHFLLLPTRAEAYGLVFAEASAYGVPSITTDVGGIGGVVTNGVNGIRMPLKAPAAAYAEWVKSIFRDNQRYQKLCECSHNEFKTRLNWDVAGRAMAQVLQKVTIAH